VEGPGELPALAVLALNVLLQVGTVFDRHRFGVPQQFCPELPLGQHAQQDRFGQRAGQREVHALQDVIAGVVVLVTAFDQLPRVPVEMCVDVAVAPVKREALRWS
jgi:hypothetical protein